MSITTPAAGPSFEDLQQLVREQPLATPLVASIALFDYDYPPPAHLREIYGAVRRAVDPNYPRAPKNLARLEPREHGKSETGTVVVPTWQALRDPETRILIMSETEDIAAGKLDECADHIERLAPRFDREIVRNSYTELKLERDATYDVPTIKAAGFKTGVTGGHYDLLVFDDLVTFKTQRTAARRKKWWEQFQDYLNLGSQGESTYLVLGTRKHRDDLYSHLIEGIGWDTRVERAVQDWSIIENGEYRVLARHQESGTERWVDASDIATIDGETETVVDVEVDRDVEVLWPERWPIEALIDDMITGYGRERSTLVWQRENQNDPSVMEGQVLDKDMLLFATELPEAGLQWYAGMDVGVEDDPQKIAEGDPDYWALAFVAYHPPTATAYLIDVVRDRGLTRKEGVDWLARRMSHIQTQFGVTIGRVLVESNQAQRWLVQDAREKGLQVERTDSTNDKTERIIDMSGVFEAGKVQLLEGGSADNWESFTREWVLFPTGAHDDQLDATEIALRKVAFGGSGWSESEYDLGEVF